MLSAYKNQGFRKLIVYQKSKDLILEVYKTTKNFPSSKDFGLILQMRRAPISVTANLAKGYSKESPKEFAIFLTISIGSLAELEVFLDLSLDLHYIKAPTLGKINLLLIEVKKLLYGTRKSAKLKV